MNITGNDTRPRTRHIRFWLLISPAFLKAA